METALPKVATSVPRKSLNPRFASSLTKAFPFFWAASYTIVCHFLKESFMFRQEFFGGSWGSRRKLQKRRREKHCPEADLSLWLPICSGFISVSPCTD